MEKQTIEATPRESLLLTLALNKYKEQIILSGQNNPGFLDSPYYLEAVNEVESLVTKINYPQLYDVADK